MNPILKTFNMLASMQAHLRGLVAHAKTPALRRHLLAARSEVISAEIALLGSVTPPQTQVTP